MAYSELGSKGKNRLHKFRQNPLTTKASRTVSIFTPPWRPRNPLTRKTTSLVSCFFEPPEESPTWNPKWSKRLKLMLDAKCVRAY